MRFPILREETSLSHFSQVVHQLYVLTHLCKAHPELLHVLLISGIIWLLLEQCQNPGEKT